MINWIKIDENTEFEIGKSYQLQFKENIIFNKKYESCIGVCTQVEDDFVKDLLHKGFIIKEKFGLWSPIYFTHYAEINLKTLN